MSDGNKCARYYRRDVSPVTVVLLGCCLGASASIASAQTEAWHSVRLQHDSGTWAVLYWSRIDGLRAPGDLPLAALWEQSDLSEPSILVYDGGTITDALFRLEIIGYSTYDAAVAVLTDENGNPIPPPTSPLGPSSVWRVAGANEFVISDNAPQTTGVNAGGERVDTRRHGGQFEAETLNSPRTNGRTPAPEEPAKIWRCCCAFELYDDECWNASVENNWGYLCAHCNTGICVDQDGANCTPSCPGYNCGAGCNQYSVDPCCKPNPPTCCGGCGDNNACTVDACDEHGTCTNTPRDHCHPSCGGDGYCDPACLGNGCNPGCGGNPFDNDCDGIPNGNDTDVDGDGVPNGQDPDVDGDGVPNGQDSDVDGDHAPNGEDNDVDGDGVPNGQDSDADGDGVGNGQDSDIDGDGAPNGSDSDMDGDGAGNNVDDDADGDGTNNGSDPAPNGCEGACCGSTDPCCGSGDPCCGSSDPCCGDLDPCCGSSDPCCSAACDDDDPCNGVETCVDGACIEGIPVDCDDDDACTIDRCRTGTGECVHEPFNQQPTLGKAVDREYCACEAGNISVDPACAPPHYTCYREDVVEPPGPGQASVVLGQLPSHTVTCSNCTGCPSNPPPPMTCLQSVGVAFTETVSYAIGIAFDVQAIKNLLSAELSGQYQVSEGTTDSYTVECGARDFPGCEVGVYRAGVTVVANVIGVTHNFRLYGTINFPCCTRPFLSAECGQAQSFGYGAKATGGICQSESIGPCP